MSTVKFPDGMNPIGAISGQDKLMVAKAGTGEVFQSTWDKAKDYLSITGELIDPVDPGTLEAPAQLPIPPVGQKRKFEPQAGYYTFGSADFHVTADKRWYFFWNGNTWSLKDMGELPKGANGKTIEPFDSTKPSGYVAGDQVFFNVDAIYEVKTGQIATTGQSPITNPEKFSLVFEGSSKSEIENIKNQISIIGTFENINLVFDKFAFDETLTPHTNGLYQNQGTIIDVSTKNGKTIEIFTNSYGTVFSGWKKADGSIISTFQLSEYPTKPLVTKVPVGADKLYISRFNNFNAKVTISDRKVALIEAETQAKEALEATTSLKQTLAYLNINHIKPVMKSGGYFDNGLIRRTLDERSSTSIIDVSMLKGQTIELYTKAFDAARCGFKDEQGNIISVFYTSNQVVPNSVIIPVNAKDMYITNLNFAGTEDLEPYFLYQTSTVKSITEYLRGFDFRALGSFFKKLALRSKVTPLNLMFGGDSIVNFQESGDTSLNYAAESLNSPAFMYNKNTFAYKVWQYLNPNTMDENNNVINPYGNLKFIKANSPSVTKGGNWYSNFTGTGYNELGTYESSELRSIREIFHSKTVGDFMEITIPSGVKGVSIVCKRFTGTKNYNGSNLSASTMKVFIGGALKDTVSLTGDQTIYFDYPINPTTTGDTIVRIENAEAKWLPVWGFEYWTDNAIRPINSAISSSTVGNWFSSSYQKLVVNQLPDLIIHEANIINDRNSSFENSRQSYKAYFEDIQSKNIPLLMLITHDTQTKTIAHTNFAMLLIELCKGYGIPYINIWKYLDDKNPGNNLSGSYFIDGVHLSTYGHLVYWTLLNEALRRKF